MNRKEMIERLEKGEDALELSIEKWQDIVDGKGEDEGTANCALCYLYASELCEDCPVSEKTEGYIDCIGTPYDDYSEVRNAPEQIRKQQAIKELEFLKSLRDGKKRTLK